MRKLPAVEDARAIMKEGMEWSMWKWLMEKKRVRGIADVARAALDEFELKVKDSWSDEHKIAYNQLVDEDEKPKRGRKQDKGNPREKANAPAAKQNRDPKSLAAVRKVKEADDEAYNAHEDAEDVFAEAERKMSTSMAKEGARMALIAYDRHEEAIRKAEALVGK